MSPAKSPTGVPTVHAEHQAVVESYLGSIRAASEEFAEAFRAHAETLRTVASQLEERGSGLASLPRESGEPGEGRATPRNTVDLPHHDQWGLTPHPTGEGGSGHLGHSREFGHSEKSRSGAESRDPRGNPDPFN